MQTRQTIFENPSNLTTLFTLLFISLLVQAMACHLFGTKILPEPMTSYCQNDSHVKVWLIEPNHFQENVFKNVVCNLSAILFMPECVDIFFLCCCHGHVTQVYLELYVNVKEYSGYFTTFYKHFIQLTMTYIEVCSTELNDNYKTKFCHL